MKSLWIITAVMLAAFLVAGCGGGEKDAKDGDDANADLEPIDQLKAVSTDLQAGVDDLMAPINEVDALIENVTSLPAKLNIDAKTFMGMVSATADSGEISIQADLDITVEAKAEVEACLTQVQTIIAGLKATPEKVKVLTVKVAEATAKVPMLAAKVTTNAQAKLANPLAKADVKVSAQADLDAVVSVQADVEASIEEVKGTITGIPAMAAEALAKLTASFAGGI